MPVIHVNADVSAEQLVRAAAQLPPIEWERFLSRVCALRPPHAERVLSHEESALLMKINQGVPVETQRRYDALIAKRRANSLTPEEYEELLRLTDDIEQFDATRITYLVELARLRDMPLPVLMNELGIAPTYA